MLLNIYQGMLDMVTKGASNGIPSLHARKRRNMVREMSDQLLDAPNKPVDDEESDKSDDVTDDDDVPDHNVNKAGFSSVPPLVNNFMEPTSMSNSPLPSGSADFNPSSNR